MAAGPQLIRLCCTRSEQHCHADCGARPRPCKAQQADWARCRSAARRRQPYGHNSNSLELQDDIQLLGTSHVCA